MPFTIQGKEVVLLGDKTTHGGTVVTASSTFTYMNIPVARKGDQVSCPLCLGTHVIAEGVETAFDHEHPIAVDGNLTSCGARLIAGSGQGGGIPEGTLYADAGNIVSDAGGVPSAEETARALQLDQLRTAGNTYTGHCAHAVVQAIEADGTTHIHPPIGALAKDYGPSLEAAGYEALPPGTPPEANDVVVIQNAPGHPAGHMAMYDGTQWISDAQQGDDFYPAQIYRTNHTPYVSYRKSTWP